jgi:hypothetical protein
MERSSQVRNPERYVKLQNLIILALSASLLRCPGSLWAKPVSVRQAEKAVRGCDSLKRFERIGCKQL